MRETTRTVPAFFAAVPAGWLSKGTTALMVGGLLVLTACGGNPIEPTSAGASTTTFVGTFAGSGGQSGTLEIAIQASLAASVEDSGAPTVVIDFGPLVLRALAATNQVSATLRFVGGGSVELVGTYDTVTRVIVMSGGGYTFEGLLGADLSSLSGTFTGPSSGEFGALNAEGDEVTTYCGTFDGDGVGFWMMQISSSGLASVVARNEGTGINVAGEGQLIGSTLTLQGTSGWGGLLRVPSSTEWPVDNGWTVETQGPGLVVRPVACKQQRTTGSRRSRPRSQSLLGRG